MITSLCKIWFRRSRVPTADARKEGDASEDTRRIPRPPDFTGELVCSH